MVVSGGEERGGNETINDNDKSPTPAKDKQ